MLKEVKNKHETKCVWTKDEDRILMESMVMFESNRQQVSL